MTQLVLGTAQWGMQYGIANRTGPPDEDTVARMLAMAWDAGVRTLDTAQAYGASEAVIGRAARHRWEIVTKLHPDVVSGDEVRPAIVGSLRRLGRDRLDVLLAHRPKQRANREVWEGLQAAVAEGLVGAVGVSVLTVNDAHDEATAVDVVQVPASLFDRRLLNQGFFLREDVRTLVRSVFLQGVADVTPTDLPLHLAPLRESVRKLRELADRSGATLPGLMLAYARDRFGSTEIVVGVETYQQLRKNLDVWASPRLPADLIDEMESQVASVPQLDELLNPAFWPADP